MKVVQNALYDAMLGVSAITSRLAVYNAKPAIFNDMRNIPHDAALPYVVINGSQSDIAYDTKTTVGRDVVTNISVYSAESDDSSLVDDVAEAIRGLFHRSPPMTISGYGAYVAICTGPYEAPAENQIFGRLIMVRLQMTHM